MSICFQSATMPPPSANPGELSPWWCGLPISVASPAGYLTIRFHSTTMRWISFKTNADLREFSLGRRGSVSPAGYLAVGCFQPAGVAISGADLRELARRRRGLPICVASPADCLSIGFHPAAEPSPGADLFELSRRRSAPRPPAVPPAVCLTVGFYSATVPAGADLVELNR